VITGAPSFFFKHSLRMRAACLPYLPLGSSSFGELD
jgi:hypothetical protein